MPRAVIASVRACHSMSRPFTFQSVAASATSFTAVPNAFTPAGLTFAVWGPIFLGLLVFYLAFTRISEMGIGKLSARLSHGQATSGGESLRKAAA